MKELVKKLLRIELAIDKNDFLTDSADRLRQEHGLKQSEQLEKDFRTIAQGGRLLKIGIIGRVNADKSSLLNALFFEGKSVLPKAATPMTAALSILSYDKEPGLGVDFYTKEDQLQIKRSALVYEEALKKKTAKIFAELESRAKKKKDTESKLEKLQQKAGGRAK